jgi:hypothetical protein
LLVVVLRRRVDCRVVGADKDGDDEDEDETVAAPPVLDPFPPCDVAAADF